MTNKYNIKVIEYNSELRYKIYKNPIIPQKKDIIKSMKKDTGLYEYAKMQYEFDLHLMYDLKPTLHNFTDTIDTEHNTDFIQWIQVNKEKIINDYQNIKKLTQETFQEEKKAKEIKSLKDSISRTIQKVYDIGKSNNWEWFITLTLDGEKVDRYNYDEVTKKLSKFFNNMKSKNPDLKYLAVPEQHKDKAFHFHMLVSGLDSTHFINSEIKTKTGSDIYNVAKYNYGFTTATQITDSNKAVGYICKYITKELVQAVPKGKKRYWASKNLNKPKETEIYISEENIEEYIKNIKKEKEYKYLKEIDINTQDYKNKLTIIEFDK